MNAPFASPSTPVYLAGAELAQAPSRQDDIRPTYNKSRDVSIGIELHTMPSSRNQTQTELPAPSISSAHSQIPKWKVLMWRASLYSVMFLEGWSDASAGPLLPTIQKHYGINFTVVSMLFVTSAAGFAIGAIVNIPLTDKYGLGKIITYCAAIQVAAYALIAPALPFPLMCVGYGLTGFTMALQNAQTNVMTTALPVDQSSAMGMLHGFYGIGAMSAPLVATQFAQTAHWSFHYLTSLGLALINAISSYYVFNLQRLEELVPDRSQTTETQPLVQGSKYRQILRQKQVYLLAIYTMIYVGAEVTTGGWIVTFLDQLRGGGPSAGYVSAGFFGGLTLGRFILWPINDLLGKTRAVYVYSALAVGLELIVWRVPNLITDAVAVSLVGMAIGPLYPIVMNVSSEVLPKWILAGSIGFVASTGQVGSALFPFLTGLLATRYGVEVLQPLVIGLLIFMTALWSLFLYNVRRRTD